MRCTPAVYGVSHTTHTAQTGDTAKKTANTDPHTTTKAHQPLESSDPPPTPAPQPHEMLTHYQCHSLLVSS